MSVDSGLALLDADALADGSVISVGVGTGGAPLSDGSGDSVGSDGGPGVAVGGGATAVVGTGEDTEGVGVAEGASYPAGVIGRVPAGRTGAAPIPPAPPTRPSPAVDAGTSVGVPRIQPIATARGRPRATMPKKRDLGERRTPGKRAEAPGRYGAIGG